MIAADQGIMITLIFAILIICYFAPIGSEGFGNTRTLVKTKTNLFNPQGSYVSRNTFINNPYSSVENWKINKGQNGIREPGTWQEMNLNNVKSGFPFNRNLPEFYNEDDIGLIKSDGTIINGFVPQILRPFDSVSANPSPESDCKWPCYSDKKFQKWCSEENAINYHAMRPIVQPNQYNDLLKKMFNSILDRPGPASRPPPDDQYTRIETAVFCTETQQSLMAWLMQKIALYVSKTPSMQKNGPWKTEMFYETDVLMYQFVNPDGSTYFKIIFNLFNPLRSVATLVVATIYMTRPMISGKPSLVAMDFVNEGFMGDYVPPMNGFGAINGHNVNMSFESVGGGMDVIQWSPLGISDSPEGMKLFESVWKKDPNEFDWNYFNTLEVQKFNKEGFFSNVPGDNIVIEGGVPDSLKAALNSGVCDEEQLMSCMMPRYTGITGPSAQSDSHFAKNDGQVHNVYVNPQVIYSNPDPMSLRKIETPAGLIYI